MNEQTIEKTYEDDPAVQAAAQRRADLQRQREAALDERRRLRPEGWGGPLPYSLDYLRADERVAALDRPLAEAGREVEAAIAAARHRIVGARRSGDDALLRRLMDATTAAIDAANALHAYRAETANTVGLALGPLPISSLLGIVREQLATLRAEIARRARPDDGPAIVPPGKVRVRFLTSCRGADALTHHHVGDVADYDEKNARDLIERRVAAAVPS